MESNITKDVGYKFVVIKDVVLNHLINLFIGLMLNSPANWQQKQVCVDEYGPIDISQSPKPFPSHYRSQTK